VLQPSALFALQNVLHIKHSGEHNASGGLSTQQKQLCFALKGLNTLAQGDNPGYFVKIISALKGRNNNKFDIY